ncbi:MAG: hypothetical protein IKO51_07555 [Clostridia bacterium]|nr:hypothetical protein [Clostridia bacterium]
MYSEQELKHAEEFREGIHSEALSRVRAVFPAADRVVDKYPADAYFQQVWDYPGKWYTVVGTPPGAGGRKDLVCAIVRETLEYYRGSGAAFSDCEALGLIAEYPDTACDYRLIGADDPCAKEEGVFPYRGADSHRLALACAARALIAGGGELFGDIERARCRKLSGKALFAPSGSDKWPNYRKAFLCPPRGNAYTDSDFDRVNAALFPGGADGLEVYRWTADRSGCSDEDREQRDALCLTVYDKTLCRFVVITAAAELSEP